MQYYIRVFSFKSLKYGVLTILFALIPVTLGVVLVEYLIDITPYDKKLKAITIQEDYDIQRLIYYVSSGLVHIIICIIIATQFALENKKGTLIEKIRITKYIRSAMLVIMFFLVYFLDAVHIDIAYLSHDRLYILLSKSPFFKNAFSFFPENISSIFNGWHLFRLFSSFPFILICVAVGVMIFGGFYIGNELFVFFRKEDFSANRIKENVSNLHVLLRNYAKLLSIVMVSSTIATILFFQLPVPLIKEKLLRQDYSNTSMAIGIYWGIIFSLTLLFLCIYPYKLAYKKVASIIQEERVKNNPELEEWIDNNKTYFTFVWNLNLITSIISPAATGIITSLISGLL